MCGIVGLVGPDSAPYISPMNDLIRHRGPDDSGVFQDPQADVWLAMQRLSIIDLASGHQPLSNEDGTIWIVFNGEIYNAPELRLRLEEQGHRFATKNADTEVLVHLYEEKGPNLVHDLNGMFALVIYDKRRGQLFAARDRLGIKPLYYYQQGGRFAFASELKSLLTLPFIDRQIDLQSLFHYLTLMYIPGEQSIIKGIRRLPPGHSLVYDLKTQQLTLQEYWQLGFNLEHHSEAEWGEVLRAELRAAVGRWTLSDVPIACSLSGGLDSSTIVGLLAELGYPQISTYSLGFVEEAEQGWSELDLARQVAQRWGTDHHEIFLKAEELLEDLMSMVWHLDEPYGGGLPSWYIFREMSKDVKVALTGTGGDELFGNYGKFRHYETRAPVMAALSLRRWSRRGADRLARLAKPLIALTDHLPAAYRWVGRDRQVSRLLKGLKEPFGRFYYANMLYLSDETKRREVFQDEGQVLEDTAAYLQQLYDRINPPDLRNGLAAVDFRTQLPEEFLFMTDRFSMAHSLEARVPFLDHLLVEKVFAIPPSMRTRGDDLKYLFKKAVGDLLPPDLLAAPKRGFVLPIELWLRTKLRPLVERLLNPERLRTQGIFRPEFYERLVKPCLNSRATDHWQVSPVWAALMFQLWHVVYIEQPGAEPPKYSWQDIC